MVVVSQDEAARMAAVGELLAHERVLGHTYGIAAASVRALVASGKLAVVDLDSVAHAQALKASGFKARPRPRVCPCPGVPGPLQPKPAAAWLPVCAVLSSPAARARAPHPAPGQVCAAAAALP